MQGRASENYALAEGVLDDIEAKGGFSTMDLKVPAEVMSQYFSIQDAVLLGQTTPEDAGAQIQAAVERATKQISNFVYILGSVL